MIAPVKSTRFALDFCGVTTRLMSWPATEAGA